MRLVFLGIALILFSFTAASEEHPRKVFECVLATAGVIERALPDDGYQNWYPVSEDILVSAPTRLGAMSKLKNKCMALGSVYTIRLVGSGAPAIHFSNQGALLERSKTVCDNLIQQSAQCEVGEER